MATGFLLLLDSLLMPQAQIRNATLRKDGLSSLASFSSVGPTSDGRLKPDIVAPGITTSAAKSDSTTYVIIGPCIPQAVCGGRAGLPGCAVQHPADFIAAGPSARSCSTGINQGTSMAAPLVAASAVLVRQYFLEGFYPSGTRTRNDAFSPSGALLKVCCRPELIGVVLKWHWH